MNEIVLNERMSENKKRKNEEKSVIGKNQRN